MALVLLPACQTDAQKETRTLPPPAIAPGTVRVDVRVNSCDQTETGAASCELLVLHVTEYGSGAGSLPVGTVLNAAFGNLVLGTVDAPPDSIMATGRLLDLTLMRQTFPEGAPPRPAWRTVQIHAF